MADEYVRVLNMDKGLLEGTNGKPTKDLKKAKRINKCEHGLTLRINNNVIDSAYHRFEIMSGAVPECIHDYRYCILNDSTIYDEQKIEDCTLCKCVVVPRFLYKAYESNSFVDCVLSGTKATFSKTPLVINTIRDLWSVIITDKHITIGCQSHTTQKWRAFKKPEIAKMDESAWDFWCMTKKFILEAADVHQRAR